MTERERVLEETLRGLWFEMSQVRREGAPSLQRMLVNWEGRIQKALAHPDPEQWLEKHGDSNGQSKAEEG